jgi:hypothetical protein
MRRILLMCLGLCLCAPLAAKEKPPITYTVPLPPAPDYSALDWLVGDWTGKLMPPGPAGDIQLNVSYALDKRFVIFHEDVTFAARDDAAAFKESWIGVLSGNLSGRGFNMHIYSSTGFITQYQVTADGPTIRFQPSGGSQPPPGWLFRRTIFSTAPGEFKEEVKAAPPDKPFFEYFSAKLKRTPATH